MYQYKPEDVDCKHCAEWRHRRCQAAGCPWLAERIEAGKVSYATVILKLFRNVKDADAVRRLGQLVLNFRGSLWLSAEHEFNTRQLLQSVGFGALASERGETHAIFLPFTCSAPTARCSNGHGTPACRKGSFPSTSGCTASVPMTTRLLLLQRPYWASQTLARQCPSSFLPTPRS